MKPYRPAAILAATLTILTLAAPAAFAADPFNKAPQAYENSQTSRIVLFSPEHAQTGRVVIIKESQTHTASSSQQGNTLAKQTRRVVKRIVQPADVQAVSHDDCEDAAPPRSFNKMDSHHAAVTTATPVFYSEQRPT